MVDPTGTGSRPRLSGASLLMIAAIAALASALIQNSPSGAPWALFFAEPASWVDKAQFLIRIYCWPAALSFTAISLLQLQFRLAASGANKRTVFSVCLFASGAMLMGLRALAFSPGAGPSYVLGMALGYTVMSQLYAVRLRKCGPVRIPSPIWRGDRAAVAEFSRMARARVQEP